MRDGSSSSGHLLCTCGISRRFGCFYVGTNTFESDGSSTWVVEFSPPPISRGEQRKQHPPNDQADDTTKLKPHSNQLNTNTDSDMRTRLLLVCPPEFKDQLHVLLNSETNIKDIKEQVLDWMMETSPRHPDSTQEK